MSEEKGFPVGPTDAGEDVSLFDGVLAGNPSDVAAGEEQASAETRASEGEQPNGERAEGDGRGRDEKGRFARNDQRQDGARQEGARPNEDRHEAGLRRELTEERSKRQSIEAEREAERQRIARLEAQLEVLTRQQSQPQQPQQQQPKAEAPPDRWTDPEGYDKWLIGQAEARVQTQLEGQAVQRVEFSLQDAQARDPQTFNAAYQAAQALDPQSKIILQQRMRLVPDAGQFLMNWHRQEQARREIGADPAAYRERVRADLLKDPSKLMEDPAIRQAMLDHLRAEAERGGQNGSPNTLTQLPPSLNNARGGNRTRGDGRWSSDGSDRATFDEVTAGL